MKWVYYIDVHPFHVTSPIGPYPTCMPTHPCLPPAVRFQFEIDVGNPFGGTPIETTVTKLPNSDEPSGR